MAGRIKFSPGEHTGGYHLSQLLAEKARESGVPFPKRMSIYGASDDWFVICYTTNANKQALLDTAKEMKIKVLEIK